MAFSSFLEENLLCLLCFDKERCRIVRGTVDPTLFGGFNREVAARAYDYIDKYKKPPADHIADLLEDKLESDNKREAKTYKDILQGLHELKETVNGEYVINQLESFIHRQSLRTIAVDLAKELQRDTEESLEKAQSLIRSANQNSLKVFDPGTRLSDWKRASKFLDDDIEAFLTGIPEFDKRGFGPTRKEMYVYIADTKTGKTWHMTHLAKIAIMNGLRTVHISLEMSEPKIVQRYAQALFALSKRDEEYVTQRFSKSKSGKLKFYEKTIKPKLTLKDPNIRAKLKRKWNKFGNRILDNIIVKQFPTGKLTVPQLESYLDNLEVTEHFVPDLIIVDYPDLMDLKVGSGGQYRHALGEVYKNLRGVAVARNAAMACPTQSNRAGSGAKVVGRKNVSEAYSKIADADVAVTYSQTKGEQALRLARLTVIAGRNDEDNITVAVSQNYGMGQFVVDSVLVKDDYWKLVEPEDESSDDNYDDDDE